MSEQNDYLVSDEAGRLKPGVSVVLCCYNSAELIVPTVEALGKMDVSPGMGYEVILVDNNCSDDTVSLARSAWGDAPYALRIVREPQPGLIHARKTGVVNARYEIVLFVDDDNRLAPDWLVRLSRLYFEMPNVGAIGGYNRPVLAADSPDWFDDFCGVYACTRSTDRPHESGERPLLFGAGLSVRTELIQNLFTDDLPFFLTGRTAAESLRGDDSEICYRLRLSGWKLWYEKDLVLDHYIPVGRLNWDYVLKCRRGGGRADIVLMIYQKLLEKASPMDYRALADHIAALWHEFWRNRHKRGDLTCLQKEGDLHSRRYAYLQGLTEGFFEWSESEYISMGAFLVTRFGSGELSKVT